MSKYDKMIEKNKVKSDEKISLAVSAIREMVLQKERISVPNLVKKTGLSRGFFYTNESVRKELDEAIEKQAGVIDPRRKIIDLAMNSKITLLQQQVSKLKYEKEELEKENQKLKKALNKKDLSAIKNL